MWGPQRTAFLVVTRERAEELVVGVLLGSAVVTLGGLVEHVLVSGQPATGSSFPSATGMRRGFSQRRRSCSGLGLGSVDAVSGWRRGLGAALATPAAAALYLSLSRGSLLAAALGLAVLGVSARSASSAGRLVIVALPALAAVLLAARIGTFGESGATVGEVASIVALTVLALVGTLLALRPPTIPLPRVTRSEAIVLGAAVGVLAVLGATLAGVHDTAEPLDAGQRDGYARPALLHVDELSWGLLERRDRDGRGTPRSSGRGRAGRAHLAPRATGAPLRPRCAQPVSRDARRARRRRPRSAPDRAAHAAPGADAACGARARGTGGTRRATSPCWPTPFSTGTGSSQPSRSARSSSRGTPSEWGASARRLAPSARTTTGLLAAAAVLGVVAVVAHVGNGAAAAHRTPSTAATRRRRGARPTGRAASRPGPRAVAAPRRGRSRAGAARGRTARPPACDRQDPGAWYAWFELAVASDGARTGERARAGTYAEPASPRA